MIATADTAAALLALVAAEPGLSLPRAAKRLSLGQSQLRRLLLMLGDAGAGLLEVDDSSAPTRLRLSAAAQRTLHAQPGSVSRAALRWRGPEAELRQEWLADETAIALLYNGVAHAVMLATPLDLEDFALGFSLSEGIIDRPGELQLIEQSHGALGLSLHLAIPSARFEALALRQRGLSGRSGCGLCGTAALDAAMRPVQMLEPAQRAMATPLAVLPEAFAALARQQHLNARCGAVHAAAALDSAGALLCVREDIGRHNALDKVLGATARAGQRAGAVLLTSRASHELVHKAAQCGVPLLASISGPTALAVETANAAGLILVGFARGDRYTIYAPSPETSQIPGSAALAHP